MNEVTIFENTEFGKLEIVVIDGKEYFPAHQCAKILGYSNPRDAVKRHCKAEGVVKYDTPTSSGIQSINFINEGNLYRLIVSSKLPSAEEFERWVFDEVLPTIRKTGSYSIQKNPDSYTIDDPIERAKRWIEEAEARKALESKIKEDEPKVALADKRLDKKGCLSITDATQSLNLKKGYITRWARAKGFLHQSVTEVNKAGEKFFKVYSSDGIHNQIGITEDGLNLINNHIDEIRSINTKV